MNYNCNYHSWIGDYCGAASACNTGSRATCTYPESDRVDCEGNKLYCEDSKACNYDGENGSCRYAPIDRSCGGTLLNVTSATINVLENSLTEDTGGTIEIITNTVEDDIQEINITTENTGLTVEEFRQFMYDKLKESYPDIQLSQIQIVINSNNNVENFTNSNQSIDGLNITIIVDMKICDDSQATNYGSAGSCQFAFPLQGRICDDSQATNYGSAGSCQFAFPLQGRICDDSQA